ncbi:MAG: DUF11 domain-containing protein, partial [Oscillospiraceae bacterium]|nr:DUF11 domain-containing protein [Oscillospiraceae bacterium]
EEPTTTNPVEPVGSIKYIGDGSGKGGAMVYIGDEITYEIRYVNTTGETADLTITDELENGLEYVSHTGDNVSQSGNRITWTLTNIAPDTSGTVTVTAKVTNAAGIRITNDAALVWSWNNGDNTSEENPSTENPAGSTKYVSSDIGADGAAVSVGDTITYTIWYANATGSDATLVITDTLTNGLQYISSSDGGTEQNGVVTWDLGTVLADATGYVTVTVNVTSQAGAAIYNSAELVWNADETEPEMPPPVVNPLFSIKYVSSETGFENAPVEIGDQITYTILYLNQNGVTADVVVTDTLGDGLSYVSSTPAATVSSDGRTLRWTVDNVEPDVSGSVEVTVRVTEDAQLSVTNAADFQWTQSGTGTELDEEESTATNPLNTTKYIKDINGNQVVAELAVGDAVTYQINYINNTGSDADSVIVTDTLPAGMTYVASNPSGSYDGSTHNITWNLGAVAAGNGGSVTVTLTVTDAIEPVDGSVTNTAQVIWANDPDNPEAPETTDPMQSYTVTYDANGGTGGYTATQLNGSSHIILSQSGTGISRSGYTFLGWGNEPSSGVTYTIGDPLVITGDITLYAQWRVNTSGGGGGSTTYAVRYNANGGTGSYADTGLSAQTEYTVLSHSETGISYSGYTFSGWNTQADGTGTAYTAGSAITISSSITLYAQWAEEGTTYTVTYLANGGTGSHESTGLAPASRYRILANTTIGITNSGYTFLGWNTSADGSGTEYAATNWITIQEDITLYAQWRQNAQGGGGKSNSLITIDDLPVPIDTFSTDHFAYIVGYPDGSVRPEGYIVRSEVTTVFFRLLNETVRYDYWGTANAYSDVVSEDWYNNSISVMTNLGVIAGYADGSFGPKDNITRAELATIATRFALLNQTEKISDTSFSDISGHWAEQYINYAASIGWLSGYGDGTFRPDAYITRAEFITIVNRMQERTPESTEDLLSNMITWQDNTETSKWYYLDVQAATNSYYYEYKENIVPDRGYYYETWTALRQVPDWSVLERPTSQPYDLVLS